MGYNNLNSERGSLVFDVEAVAIDGAADFMEPPQAPANYKDPVKIASYLEEATRKQLGECALDLDLARIVAIGMTWSGGAISVGLCQDEATEARMLRDFWGMIAPYPYPRLVGFNLCGYDLPLMMRRSLYLGVPCPSIPIGRYKHPDVDDLMLSLSFDGAVKFRSLWFYCKRFGIQVPDETTGADIAGLVAEGHWEAVEAHCRADVQKTVLLAQKCGFVAPSAAGSF